ncbi:hypothetical protein [Paenibacillus anaericanus]|uniref:hypothetical protein n=1 Tax=Paenibacillus anaericanus TaxID=170367 RepID=UPI001FE943A3|nr:hypothetical protein [Paenibacillus anaericanus]
MIKKSNELPILYCEDELSFEHWLGDNFDSSPGIWLQIAKKDSGMISVTYYVMGGLIVRRKSWTMCSGSNDLHLGSRVVYGRK